MLPGTPGTQLFMKIHIETIAHGKQRYDTLDDFWIEGDTIEVRISKMDTPVYEHAILVHALVELLLCSDRGVPFTEIDRFDFSHLESSEPGDEPDAPYKQEHSYASVVERLYLTACGKDWKEYTEHIKNIS